MKGVIRICKPKKDRQHNDQKKKDKRTNNDLQSITHKTKDRVTQNHTNNRGELRCSRRISSSFCTNFMLSIINDAEHEFSYFSLSFFQLIIWINQQMALTMLKQTMGVWYICMYKYFLSVSILNNILYNQMSLLALNR